MNPYQEFVQSFTHALTKGQQLPLGGFPHSPHSSLSPQAPRVLLFSPHPDDEVIIGGLPLRLRRELKMNVLNVAVTQGSNKARQAERLLELHGCCDHVGFGLIPVGENGLENIHLKTRQARPDVWAASVDCIARILEQEKPHTVFFPHDADWNSTHIGTHHLVMDALSRQAQGFECFTVETEFWGAMDTPNLMVESSTSDLEMLLSALTFHVGEVKRNPYHLRFPAWLIDNVRRGGELVGGQGGAPPDFAFATLYRLRRWQAGKLQSFFSGGRFLAQSDNPADLFTTNPSVA